MIKHKIIKTDKGRVTIQTNSFGIPQIKVRVNNQTYKVGCYYNNIREIENVVYALLNSREN
ncbi:hypothetical protein [Metabacillus sp. Hm71]|uniref:hypothetical protein n=1 Tax=Metabacillus sp. Hm71 TaxID=3450743 RepID=UPI003F42FE96